MNSEPTTASAATDSEALDATLSQEIASTDIQATPATNDQVADSTEESPNAEAAKWRRKFRAAETELAAAHEQIARFQRAAIEQIAAERLSVPGDLFDIGGFELASLLDEHGDPDADKVKAAMTELLTARPRLSKYPPGQRHMNWGQGQGAPVRGSGSSWNKLLKG